MIKTQDAIATARALIGTPYSELDCINLIKRVIHSSSALAGHKLIAGRFKAFLDSLII